MDAIFLPRILGKEPREQAPGMVRRDDTPLVVEDRTAGTAAFCVGAVVQAAGVRGQQQVVVQGQLEASTARVADDVDAR